MARTEKQETGDLGECVVSKYVPCPGCKGKGKLKLLQSGFKAADVICDFCGYLAQVKTTHQNSIDELPKTLLGSSWKVQEERMNAGIFIPLFVVVLSKNNRKGSIWFLPRDLQTREMFEPRKRLEPPAQRAGWQGCIINLEKSVVPAFRLKIGKEDSFSVSKSKCVEKKS